MTFSIFGTRQDLLAAVAEHVETTLQAEFTELTQRPDLGIPDLVRRYWATTKEHGASQ
jgi:hypothetical protein